MYVCNVYVYIYTNFDMHVYEFACVSEHVSKMCKKIPHTQTCCFMYMHVPFAN